MNGSKEGQEALRRAIEGQSVENEVRVIEAFMNRGIPEEDIIPRRNVFTYPAWQELGRQVRKGEHGVRLQVWISKPEERDESGKVTRKASTYPKYTTVFHVSQTDPKDRARKQVGDGQEVAR